MNRKFKTLIALLLCVAFMFTSAISTVLAKNDKDNTKNDFKDVPSWHWAYDDIMWMFDNDFINGTGNGLFNPNGTVSRAEFAKMMVNTLSLSTYSPDNPSFLDVKKNDWAYSYVESAKPYLTGFRTSSGDYFKPDLAAVREDMAVALVKALGYQNESVDLNILNSFEDAASINTNLRKYVALSVKFGLIEGYTENGRKLFGPQNNLTRAQAATLMSRAFKKNEEKITYDDEKVTYDDTVYFKPSVSVNAGNNGLTVSWTKINSTKLQGYAVVISKDDSSPVYPDNGFLYYITDKSQTSASIDNSIPYNSSSDFGKYLEKGKKYYISVTAIYSDKNVAGNVVQVQYNGTESPDSYVKPAMKASEENGQLVLRWDRINSSKLQAYAVVISKDDSSPVYPDNGFLYYITDKSQTSVSINNSILYNGNSDFGRYLEKGKKYYMSITAIYNDKTVAGNVVHVKYNAAESPDAYVVPAMKASDENGQLVLRWDKIQSTNLQAYAVVISKDDSSPVYPDNGFLYYITDRSQTSVSINNSIPYNGNSDFGRYLEKGKKYYMSIAAIYSDKTVAGNVVRVQYNGAESPDLYVTPAMTASEENGRLVLRWNKIQSSNFQYYMVVASKYDSNPSYPDNGYLYKITDRNINYAIIDSNTEYKDGDFGKYLSKGDKYYFSITAVYNDKNVQGNTVQSQYNGPDNPSVYPAPSVKAAYEDGKLVLKWDRIDSSELKEYRVVVSKGKKNPAYPEDGYYKAAYDKSTTSVVIDPAASYSGGDFGTLTDGTIYYVSVTAVYNNDKYIAGNAIDVLYLLPPK